MSISAAAAPRPPSRQAARTILVWLGICCLQAASAFAQRELHWDSLDVTAHLNADGALRVVETHAMVFTGDWNGGERRFNIRPRQKLSLSGIYRGTPGDWQALTRDARLDDVDEFAFTDPQTLRWRSRRTSDPPFGATTLRYQLRYILSGILLKEDDQYRLDHDFAFPDRPGPINRFELRLTLDPAWQPMSALRPVYTAGPMAANTSFVLNLPLRYVGTTVPAALDLTRPPIIVDAVWVVAGWTTLAVLWFFVREERRGRFAPLARDVDEAWLREHVLNYPAEIVAAIWDDNIGTAEVVALIARLVADGKLESSVGKGESAPLTLRLKVDRSTLQGHERTLVDKLFFDGRTETSTTLVRAHYRTKGFNPADEIRPELQTAVDRLLPGPHSSWRLRAVSLGLFALGTGVLMRTWFEGYDVQFGLVLAMVALSGVGLGLGWKFRAYLDWGRRTAWLCLGPALAIAIGVVLYLWNYAGTGYVDLQATAVVGLTAVALSCVHAAINALKSRRGRDAVAFRKALTAGRAYFASELGSRSPALSDEWYPWLLAFELGKQADAWSAERPGTDAGPAHASAGSSQASSSSGARWTGFSGGRSGGAGGGASWLAAASGMAARVAPPSSSGSGGSGGGGGGSSGGGSSGGGGGGGW